MGSIPELVSAMTLRLPVGAMVVTEAFRIGRWWSVFQTLLDQLGNLPRRVDQLAATIQEDELLFAISRLAIECDRLEYLLVGRDRF